MKKFIKDNALILSISLINLLLHFYNNAFTSYGYFRDELYYITCTDHLAAGYVDQPPLSIYILSLNRIVFGDSLFALRLLPSVANALVIFLTGHFVKKFGGRTFAQILACVGIGFAPGIVGMFGIYSMNAFDILLWQLVLLAFLQLIDTELPHYWYIIGALIGIGLMIKISMGWLAAGIVVAVVVTPMRKWMRTPYPWVAAGISFALFLPYIIWNLQNDLAHIEFARNASGSKYASQNIMTFVSGLILNCNPIALPLWFAGLWLFISHRFKKLRFIGISIGVVLLILILNIHSKPEYFNPALPVLFAGGAVLWEQLLQKNWHRTIGYFYTVFIFISGVIVLPLAIDLLPVETYIRYSQTLGLAPTNSEGKKMGSLPQHFADRFGWIELSHTVTEAYNSISEKEKSQCLVYAQNYGEASAINFFGKKNGSPLAISGHNAYWTWGYGGKEPDVVLIIGGKADDHRQVFENVKEIRVHTNRFAMPYESELPIYDCRGLKVSLEKVWNSVKHFD